LSSPAAREANKQTNAGKIVTSLKVKKNSLIASCSMCVVLQCCYKDCPSAVWRRYVSCVLL